MKKRLLVFALVAVVAVGGMLPLLNSTRVTAETFADPAFNTLWNVTDSLVADGTVKRTWFWGPTPGFISHERYDQAPNGSRLVQYFEKGRMEINNPNGDHNNEFFVTGGLLVLDMVTGNQQVGDNSFIARTPSTQIVAGDGGDPNAPTYTSFRSVASLTLNGNRIPANIGGFASTALAVNGSTSSHPSTDQQAQIVAYSDIFGHNIPRAMWNFMNAKGPIKRGGVVQTASIINWIFVLGYPISDAYWARVKIAGQDADVLIQLFQRRTLVYAPSLPAGFQLQMGNVGSHYFNWLYYSSFPCPTGIACNGTPTPTPNSATPTTTPTPAAGLPANVDANISPTSGPAGTKFNVSISKMQAGEFVAAWVTRMSDNQVTPLPDPPNAADANGNLSGLSVDSSGFSDGVYAVTYYGRTSKHSSIAYFLVGSASPSPTAPSATVTPTPLPPGTASATISPTTGGVDTVFTVTGSGFQANERVGIWFTDPNGVVLEPPTSDPHYADANGGFSYQFKPSDALPSLVQGQWAFSMQGVSSNRKAVVNFGLSR